MGILYSLPQLGLVFSILIRSVKLSEVAKPGDSEINTTECIAYSAVTHQPQSTEYEIPTVPCEAYGQSQQIPRVQEAVYEVIPGEDNLPPAQI